MAFTNLGNITWSSSSPKITGSLAYEYQRSGTSMQYRVKVTLDSLPYSDSRYGYNILCTIKLDGATKVSAYQIKGDGTYASGGYTYTTDWLTVSNKTSGSTSLSVRIYTTSDPDGISKTYSYSLTVTPSRSTIGNVTATIGTAKTINVTRQNSSFTHTITYKFGSLSGTIGSAKTSSTSISWTPPNTFYLQMVGKTSATGTISIETFDGNTSLGKNDYTLTINASTAYKAPAVSNFTFERGTRVNNTWTPRIDGSDIKLSFNFSLSNVASNTATATVKVGNSTVYSGSIVAGTREYYFVGAGVVNTYTATVSVTDTIGSSKSWSITIPTLSVPFDINVDIQSIAFGKIAEHEKTVEIADDWQLLFKTISSFNSSGGHFIIGGVQVCFGTGTITPSAANTSTTDTVSFSRAFSATPFVIVGLGGQPEIDRLNISCASTATSQWTVAISASNTTTRRYYWIAVGKS